MDELWARNSEDVGLTVCAISFQDFQPKSSWSTNVTDRWTDRRTDDMRSQDRALHYSASRVKNSACLAAVVADKSSPIKLGMMIGPRAWSCAAFWDRMYTLAARGAENLWKPYHLNLTPTTPEPVEQIHPNFSCCETAYKICKFRKNWEVK